MKRLQHDERGAIMVIGLFMAVFAVGCLYYVVGIGEAIWQRERMQDAADAAAFSAAVLHARGMNVIALVNMTMAALLAVLIALKLAELVAYAAIAIAAGMAYVSWGLSLSVIPPIAEISQTVKEAHDIAKEGIHPALRALRIALRGVRVAIPWIAQARTIEMVTGHYSPPATIGFAVPGRVTLPTRDGTFEDLCDKAGEYATDLVLLPFGAWSAGSLGAVPAAMAGLIDAGSGWFCGTQGDETPPSIETSHEVEHPLLPSAKACRDYEHAEPYDAGEHRRLCEAARAEAEKASAAVDPITGACVAETGECNVDGLYELRATQALTECAPSGDDSLHDFSYQEHRFKRRYLHTDGKWVIDADVVDGSESYVLHTKGVRPCSRSWNTVRRRNGVLVPVCVNEIPPDDEDGVESELREVEHIRVLSVLGCKETWVERRSISEGQGSLAPSDGSGDEMAPQLMEQGIKLGEQDFQMRAAVIGALPSNSVEHVLSSLRGVAQQQNREWEAAQKLGRVSVAQAEYFYDVENSLNPDPSSWLWSMRWKARLRRFRLPTDAEQSSSTAASEDLSDVPTFGVGDVASSLADACNLVANGDDTCELLDLSFSDLVVH